MDWSTFFSAVASSAVIGSLVSSLLDTYGSRTQAREDRHTTNIDAARDALAPLRTAYLKAGQAHLSSTDTGAVLLTNPADGDQGQVVDFVALENEFDAAIGKCDNEGIRLAAEAYKVAGQGYASRDPVAGVGDETSAYQALQAAMNSRTRRFRPRGLFSRK